MRPSICRSPTASPARRAASGSASITFNVDDARAAVYALKARIGAGENVFETLRKRKALKAKQGITVDEVIEARIAWMSEVEKKEDGEMRPRIETWENVASHLRRLVGLRLGSKLATEVTRSDIAELSNDIIDGKFGVASVSNARHMRRAVSGLFNWALDGFSTDPNHPFNRAG